MTATRIPLFDLRLADEDVAAVEVVLRSGWLSMGPRTQAFEEAFAAHLGVRHALATSSCTAALHLAYLAAGVGPGDEVIVPAITFVATAAAVRYCGARPVLADVLGSHDLGVDPADVEGRITPRTKAVCAVHFAGYPVVTQPLRALCERHGLALIEDTAHAPHLPPVGLAGAFSFFANKVLSCGEGGLVATEDDEVAALVRSRRSHAMTAGTWDRHRGHAAGYDVTALGYNYRLDEARAALLASRLPRLGDEIAARRALVHRYRALLAAVEGVTVPYRDEEVERSACYVMPIVIDEPAWREPLREALSARGVQTSVLYPAVHEFAAYADQATGGLRRAERLARTEVTLPLYPHLTHADQDHVVQALDESVRALRD